jgi:gliding motility-associated-like protein
MTCKKLLSLALLIIGCILHSHAQVSCPPNLDFELGTFANWHYYRGAPSGPEIDGGGCCPISTPTYCGYGVACTTPTVRHQLMSGAGTDPCCSFPVVPPGAGTYTLKLGNTTLNAQAEKVRYYINVPPSLAAFSVYYRYAIVLQDASHTAAQQPRFEVRAYDSATNAPLPCAQFSYVTSSSLPGFYSVSTPPCGAAGTPIRCKAWTTQSLNLSGLGGTTVAVDFATGDCDASGHFGYAYIDLSCGLFAISSVACGTAPITLSAPSGFAYYTWYDSTTFSPVLGTLQAIVLPSPPVATTFACVIAPYPGFGCADTIYTRVVPSDLHLYPSNDTAICPGETVRLTDSAVDVVVGPVTHTWTPATGLSCSTCAVVMATPTVTTTYTVTTSNSMGCTQTDSITVLIIQLAVSHVTFTNPTVCGLNDGTVTLWGLTPLKPYTITYTDPLGAHTVTGVVAADSSAVLTGLVGYSSGTVGSMTYTFNITVGLCTTTATVTLTDPPPYMPSFDTVVILGCEGDRVNFINTSVPSGYYSFWTYGDGTPEDNATSPAHIFHTESNTPKYTGNYTITLAYNTTPSRMPHCELSTTKVFAPDHQIHAVYTTDVDTTCLGVPFNFINGSTTHHNPAYKWTYQPGVEETITNVATIPGYAFPVGGQYRALLTVTDEIGCVDTVSHPQEVVSVNVKAGFGLLSYLTPNADTSVCLYNNGPGAPPDSIFLRAYDSVVYSQQQTGNSSYHVDWTWMPSGNNPATGGLASYNTQFPKFAGLGHYTYSVIAITSTFTCRDTQEVIIHSHPPLVLTELTPSGQLVPLGSTIQLHAAGATYYWWTPDDGTLNDANINNPVATPRDTTTVYTVHGMNPWGCPAEAPIIVYVDNNTEEFIPSAFTPNGDGLNDIFRPLKIRRFQKLVDFRVYNRWGELLYQTITPDAGWDGTFKGAPQDMGTYHYSVIIQRPDGKEKQFKGTVDLIR